MVDIPLQKLTYIFGSKTKAQEILFLKNNLKPVVRQGFYLEELSKPEKYCKENNLHLVKSRFKVLLADEAEYSNKGIRIKEDDKRRGMYFVYISKNEEDAWLAAYHEMMNDHRGLGKVLGYPKCCVDFFLRNFSSINPNPQILPVNPWTNISMRDKDCTLISHFPCSADCSVSISIAKHFLDLVANLDKQRAREMMEMLRP